MVATLPISPLIVGLSEMLLSGGTLAIIELILDLGFPESTGMHLPTVEEFPKYHDSRLTSCIIRFLLSCRLKCRGGNFTNERETIAEAVI